MERPPYSLALLRALNERHRVYVTVRQGPDTYSGIIVGIGSKLGIQSGGELIEDVPVDWVIHADVRPPSDYAPREARINAPDTLYGAYHRALMNVPGAVLTLSERLTGNHIPGAFAVRVHFPNGYGVDVARNDLSYGGETIAMFYRNELLREAPDGTDIPTWNDLRLGGPDDAARVATQVASLPAREC